MDMRGQVDPMLESARHVYTHKVFSRSENELLVELSKIEKVFRLSTLLVDSLQKVSDNLDNLDQVLLVRVPFRCVL